MKSKSKESVCCDDLSVERLTYAKIIVKSLPTMEIFGCDFELFNTDEKIKILLFLLDRQKQEGSFLFDTVHNIVGKKS